jgi:tRNA threonylcarbamoyladenosine biosynthesis protein TsaE
MEYILKTHSHEETVHLGYVLASYLTLGNVVTLSGDLGAGKTTFAEGLARGLNINEAIISPTFNIMRIYKSGKLPLFHIDAYRLSDGNEELGLEEFIDDEGISVIEWPEYINQLIPQHAINISINIEKGNTRILMFSTDNKELFPFLEYLKDLNK